MDETQVTQGQADAWALSRVGNAIDALVDRTLNRPQVFNDSGQQYGVDGNGNLYPLGGYNMQQLPARQSVITTGGLLNNPMVIIAVLVVMFVEMRK